jgi:NNP family nitrate/nitrite transporter-like MFS transporter
MFLFGLITSATAPNCVKAVSTWFRGKELTLANGVFSLFTAVGFMTGSMISATVLSPLLGSWRNVLFFYGASGLIVCILWMFSRGTPSQHASAAGQPQIIPFRQSIAHVVRIKRVWILAILLSGQIACVQGMLGYLPTYLRDIGWAGINADSAATLFHAASMLGALPLAMLSNKSGFRYKMMFLASLATAIGVGMLSLSGGPLVWVAVIIAGMFRDGFMALISTTIIETEAVGTRYAGTALGLAQTVTRITEFFSPPIGNSLATINPRYAFGFWSALCAASLGAYIFLRDRKNAGRLGTPQN